MDSCGHISSLSESIIKALLYYDLFDYPLTPDEIFLNLPTNHVSRQEVRSELDVLVNRTIVHRVGDFFSVRSNHKLAEKRIEGNALAQKYMSIAAGRANALLIACDVDVITFS